MCRTYPEVEKALASLIADLSVLSAHVLFDVCRTPCPAHSRAASRRMLPADPPLAKPFLASIGVASLLCVAISREPTSTLCRELSWGKLARLVLFVLSDDIQGCHLLGGLKMLRKQCYPRQG